MKRIGDSVTEQTRVIRYQHLNGKRRLFGGLLMQWIDEVAGTVAIRHTGGEVVTAAVDSLEFTAPAFLGDLVVMKGQLTYIGNTSMEVRVDTYVECAGGERSPINKAYLVLVYLDGEGRPAPIPEVTLETEAEREEWALGLKRHNLRKERRKEHY